MEKDHNKRQTDCSSLLPEGYMLIFSGGALEKQLDDFCTVGKKQAVDSDSSQ